MKEIEVTKKEKIREKERALEYKLYEEANKLKVVSEFLNGVVDEMGEIEDSEKQEKLWGAQLIVEEVAKNIMSFRQEFLGA
jgi:hypothetical protein